MSLALELSYEGWGCQMLLGVIAYALNPYWRRITAGSIT